MIDRDDIIKAAEEALAGIGGAGYGGDADGGGLFLVEVKVLPSDEVEVFIDSDGRREDGRLRGVSVEDCVVLTKAIEARFDRDAEDFSLTVSSAGIGQPLKAPRQYLKLVGGSVEVVLNDGAKLIATLEGIEDDGITLSYDKKQKTEGKKRPETVKVTETFRLADIKTTKEHIDFK